jgi:hypothetical protein
MGATDKSQEVDAEGYSPVKREVLAPRTTSLELGGATELNHQHFTAINLYPIHHHNHTS